MKPPQDSSLTQLQTLPEFIYVLGKYYAKHLAIVEIDSFRRREYTYKQLHLQAKLIAGFLQQKKSKKVVLVGENGYDWVCAFMGCVLAGVVVVPLDRNASKQLIKESIKETKADLIISDSKHEVKAETVLLSEFAEKARKANTQPRKVKAKAEDIVEIVYTSGTTSKPKGVALTHKNIISNIRNLREVIRVEPQQKFLSVLPLSHMLEQTVGLFVPMRFGASITYVKPVSPRKIRGAIHKETITHMVAVPYLLSQMHSGMRKKLPSWLFTKPGKPILSLLKNKMFGQLEVIIVGGARLNADVEEIFDAAGVIILQGYGMTEASPIISCNTYQEHRIGSVGKPLPNQEIKIKDEEIITRGDNVFGGYYQNKKATQEVLQEGWLHTGDIGEIREGYLYITGRKKNMILSASGQNIYPEDIEATIKQQSGIKDACVVAIGEDEQTRIGAAILGSPEKNWVEQVNSRLESYQQLAIGKQWSNDDFPRTPSKKIKRKEIAKYLASDGLQKRKYQDPLLAILAKVCKQEKAIQENDTMADLKLDSLARVMLIGELEEELDRDINEAKITPTTTVKQLREILKENNTQKKRINKLNTSVAATAIRTLTQKLAIRILEQKITLSTQYKKFPNNPFVLIANHASHLDIMALLATLPEQVRKKTAVAAAQDYFFEAGKIKAAGARIILNAFPFDREGSVRASLAAVGQLLDTGYNVILFPEGTRSPSGKLQPFKEGIGLLAVELQATILPAKIIGAYELLPKGASELKAGNVHVEYGQEMKFSRNQSYNEVSKQLHEAISTLKNKQD